MKYSNDIVAEAVKKYYKKHKYLWDEFRDTKYLVATFNQKYCFDKEWSREVVMLVYNHRTDSIIFADDFCEGQTDVKDVHIHDLDDVLEYFKENYKE